MGRRYSNIKQGTELKKAQEAYEKYQKEKTTKKTNGGTVGLSKKSKQVAVVPFSTRTIDTLLCRVTEKSLATLTPVLTTRVLTTPIAISAASVVKGAKAARFHFFEPDSDNRFYQKSKQTNQYYIKYPGQSYSAPVGALSSAEEEVEALRLVKGAAVNLLATSKAYRRFWSSSERIPT